MKHEMAKKNKKKRHCVIELGNKNYTLNET